MDTTRQSFFKRLAAGFILAAAACFAQAQQLDKPLLLVAAPKSAGLYAGAVLIVVPKRDGHVGFIINRVTHATVASAFSDEPDLAKVVDPIYFGGPNDAQSMYAVVRRDPGEGALRLFGDVFVTISATTVDRIIAKWPGEARFFAGYAAWEPGMLAEEVQAGRWVVTEPDAAQLFSLQPAEMWQQLLQRSQNTL
jgi:putative AlgH/UPF0301 family transcriptional regulator